jgi:tetratricopeptide (TPR) repeat protein
MAVMKNLESGITTKSRSAPSKFWIIASEVARACRPNFPKTSRLGTPWRDGKAALICREPLRVLLGLAVPLLLGALAGGFFPSRALAIDFVKDSPPVKWVQKYLPEDLPDLNYPGYFNDFDKAKLQMQTGRYKLSLITLTRVKNADPVEVAIVKASSLSAIGRADDALAALSADKIKNQPQAQVLAARILASQGKLDDAITLLKQHLQANPKSLEGHYELGRIEEQAGDLDAARKNYSWFVQDRQLLDKWRGNTGEAVFENAHDVVIIGKALDRWASLTGAYKDNNALHNSILNMFVKAYDVIDRGYEPAHVAAAEYYLSHDDKPGAGKELKAALDQNPNDVNALSLLARISLDTFNFDGADEMIASIRDVQPDGSAIADLLDARNDLQQRRPQDAFAPIQRVLKEQPKNLEALGLLAATYALRLQDDKSADVLHQVDQIDPDNATAYFEVAEQLGGMRQYPRAEKNYKIAINRAPWWTAPRNGLGLLYTQSGDEDNARATLEAAHALDPFNLATTNYLRLLDDLAKFARSETQHFVVFYDAKADPVIPIYFGEYLESVYKQVTSDFKCEPKVKTYIEVFPTHDAFSVRTTGSPWIGTVGASTGRVIALVSPRNGKYTMGTFNWAQVLRHEFTHTVTLAATDNRISHWMTEGLAVMEEQSPLQWAWVPMLNDAVKHDELFSIEDLTWAFVRPRRPIDRQLAYAESFWICTYIDKHYGRDKLLAMLASEKQGASEPEMFQKVLGKSTSAFQDEFFAWTKQQVKGWGYDEETDKKIAKLEPEAQKLLDSGAYEQALPLWEQIHKLRPMDQLPHMRLAAIYMKEKKTDDAVKQLEAIDAVELKDNRYSKGIARLYRDEGKLDLAAHYALRAVYINPYDDAAHELLAELYEKTGNQTGLSREKRVLDILAQWKQQQDAAESSTP